MERFQEWMARTGNHRYMDMGHREPLPMEPLAPRTCRNRLGKMRAILRDLDYVIPNRIEPAVRLIDELRAKPSAGREVFWGALLAALRPSFTPPGPGGCDPFQDWGAVVPTPCPSLEP